MSSGVMRDEWLTERLGKTAWKISDPRALPEQLNSLEPTGFAYCKCAVTSVDDVALLHARGFSLIDTNVVFDISDSPLTDGVKDNIFVRLAANDDEAAVRVIAESAFTTSRFHLDPKISSVTAATIKSDWAANYFRGGRGDAMVISVDEAGSQIGFLQLIEEHSSGYLIIDLIGVAPQAQCTGAGRAMIAFAWSNRGTHFKEMRVGTQLANKNSITFYEKIGFRFNAAQYVFHAHW